MTSRQSAQLPDREQNGLRGPVRSVIEEQTYFAGGDGSVGPEFKSWKETEYDREGRITATRLRGSSREHGYDGTERVTRYTYEAAGQLLHKSIQNEKGESDGEIVYHYDQQGRLQSIASSKNANNPIAFRYDANGKKSKIAIAQPFDLPHGSETISHSIEASFETGSSAPALPEGGSTVTLYDDHDQPIEIQTRSANGEIVSRTVRVYDDQGRVVEEKQIMDDPLKVIPAGDQKRIFASGDVSPNELRDKLAEFLGGSEMWSIKYTYDAQGRRSTMIRTLFNHVEEQVESAYNEHGDVAKETTRSTTRGTPNAENDGTESSETIYSYEYDTCGNWIVKKSSSRSLPDRTSKDTGPDVHRTIEYF